jgi:hypothetical protein
VDTKASVITTKIILSNPGGICSNRIKIGAKAIAVKHIIGKITCMNIFFIE